MAPSKARKPEINPWGWVATVLPEEIKIEHLLKTYRIVDFKQCIERRRNCKVNPYCCWGLGEKKWVLDGEEEPEEDDYGFREEGEFAGLQNLGATCYVNSLLQLWFHNPILRPAILRWTPTAAIYDDNYRPKCAIAQLQAMFARMKVSKRSKIDPTQFVHSLKLDTGEQQDAQEFSKLFMDVIVKLLTEDENSEIMNNVATAFRGELQNETECLGCENKTSRQQSFSELELGVRKNLNESLDDLLVDEKMTGSEQYFCSVCQKKNDAIRRTQLLKLPPVLNLQLMRFVFDRDTLRKKKVTTSIQFPEILTMTDRIYHSSPQLNFQPLVYHLTAVLVHNGPSASSGHYVAQIKDIRTGDWHKFNDETVDRLAKAKSRKLVLKEDEGSGSGSDSEKKGKTKKSKSNLGTHTSPGAYMLVYILENYVKNPEPDPELWPYLKTLVQNEDLVFEEEFKKTKNDKDYENQFQKQRRLEVAMLYPDLQLRDKAENLECQAQANDNEEYIQPPKTKIARMETPNGFPSSPTHDSSVKDTESIEEIASIPREAFSELSVAENYENIDFISADWLQQWLDQNNPPPPIENGMLKCEHDKLAPPSPNSNACLYRIVPSEFADMIYSNYNSEGTRFRGLDALCKVCVHRECERLRFLQELEDDHKQFLELSKKFESKCSPFFKNGQNLPVEILKESCWIGKETNKKWKRMAKSRVDEKSKLNKAINGDQETDNVVPISYEDEDYLTWPLNSEIKCNHDNLILDESGRKLLPFTALVIIKKYFPDCLLISAENSETCSSCQNQKVEDTAVAKRNREIAGIQKSKLNDLFNDRNRPDVDKTGEFYIVSQSFIMSWKKFIKDSSRHDPVQQIENQHLICDHNKYMYPLMYLADVFPQCRDVSPDEELVSFVHPKEWAFMKDNFKVDHEIKVTVKIPNCKDGIFYNPGECEVCAMEWWMQAYEKQFQYENEPIYVIRKDKDYPEENSDEDLFIPIPPGPASSKRERKERDPLAWMTKPWVNGSSNGSSDSVRRSQRPRRTRGEKIYKVSSSLTIKELKVMILRDFKALPSDQHLFVSQTELSDPTKTLCELQIPPGEKIYLEIDTVTKPEDEEPVAAAETGFQGTLLMGDRS